MFRALNILLLFAVAFVGFGLGSGYISKSSSFGKATGAKLITNIHPEREFPLHEYKPFVVALYVQNDADWCERSLRSIFEQDYEYFRLVLIDDGSVDGTLQRVKDFIVNNAQEHRVIIIQNETPCGFSASLYRAVSHCLDREIVIPLSGKDWMASSSVLSHWNRAFQNPDVWISFGKALNYPSYEFREPPTIDLKVIGKKGWGSSSSLKSHCFYSAIFKQIPVQNLSSNYLSSLLELAGGRVKNVWEPVCFINETRGLDPEIFHPIAKSLQPLKSFPKNFGSEPLDVDAIVFSQNNPIALYAALESLQRNVTGLSRVTAVCWGDEPYAYAYEQLKNSFPDVYFLLQGREFKRSLFTTALASPAAYILLTTDTSIVKEAVDVRFASDLLNRTRAEAFLLTATKITESTPLSDGVIAWDPKNAALRGLEMRVYRKSHLTECLKSLRNQNLDDVESVMKKSFRANTVCLSFGESKTFPLQEGKKEELLSKFNQGLKFDLETLYRGENLEFIAR